MRRPDRATWPRWARLATTGWVLSPLVVITLVVGTFAGYGAYTRARPTHYARGGATFGLMTTPGPAAPATPIIGSGRPRAAATQSRTPRTAQSQSQSPITSSSPNHVVDGSSPSGATMHRPTTGALVTPATGRYGLAVSGSERVSFGPVGACNNTFPTSATLDVSRASGETPTSYDFDLRLYPSQSGRHDERHIYRYTPAGVFLDFEQATVTCSGVKQSTAVNYSPSQPKVELPLKVGSSWMSRGGDSGRTEAEKAWVVGTQRLRVDGRTILTYIIDDSIQMSGSESGTRAQRWWFAPSLGLPLKWSEQLDGSRSGASYREQVTCTVTKLP